MTENETRTAQGMSPTAAQTPSEPHPHAQQVASDAVSNAPADAFPSRRSLRSTVPPVAPSADHPAVLTPPAPGSRRAVREARAASEAPVYAADAVPAVPLAPQAAASVVSVPQVAAPFGTFELPAAAAAGSRVRREGAPAASAPAPRAVTTGPAGRRSGTVRKRLSVAGTMVLVGGLFVSLTLPAYGSADYTGELVEAAEDADGQTLALKAEVASTEAAADTRDTYDTVSATDLKRLYRDALKQERIAVYLASGAQALGDDYPWATELGMSQGGGLSPLRYFVRQCVDFVAWRLNRDAGSYGAPFKYDWSSLTPGGGNASSWKRQWESHGWATSTTPSPGWVAWFPGGNHVAYVNSVLGDGSVLIEEYNWGGADVYNQRIIDAGSAIYLSPPPR